ncbi:MAG: hypothetical protein P8107_02975 [Spirochaetia bacterium]
MQYGADGNEFYRHSFSYYDEVRDGDEYNGFGGEQTVNDNKDLEDFQPSAAFNSVSPPILGSSTGDGSGVHSYLGVGFGSTKLNSVGVKLGYNKSDDNGEVTLVDINGDGVADKVYKGSSGFYFRAGSIDAQGNLTFPSDEKRIEGNFPGFSQERSTSYSLGGEAYLGTNAASACTSYVHTTTTTRGDVYLADVNGDGLIDAVDNGMVYFNHLVNGVPTFSMDSGNTPVPITGESSVDVSGDIADTVQQIYDDQLKASPLIDSVRAWEAPFTGTVTLSGAVVYTGDGSGPTDENAAPDGVSVIIEKGGARLWHAPLNETNTTADYLLRGVEVHAGERIYFRVNSKFDGWADQVEWDPVITYEGKNTDLTDANGLTPYRYKASKDFVYAGRSGEIMPGCKTTVNITGNIYKNADTGDDVTIRIRKVTLVQTDSGIEKQFETIFEKTLAWDYKGEISLDGELNEEQRSITPMKGFSFEVSIRQHGAYLAGCFSYRPSPLPGLREYLFYAEGRGYLLYGENR